MMCNRVGISLVRLVVGSGGVGLEGVGVGIFKFCTPCVQQPDSWSQPAAGRLLAECRGRCSLRQQVLLEPPPDKWSKPTARCRPTECWLCNGCGGLQCPAVGMIQQIRKQVVPHLYIMPVNYTNCKYKMMIGCTDRPDEPGILRTRCAPPGARQAVITGAASCCWTGPRTTTTLPRRLATSATVQSSRLSRTTRTVTVCSVIQDAARRPPAGPGPASPHALLSGIDRPVAGTGAPGLAARASI
jgi:hypothetical protein